MQKILENNIQKEPVITFILGNGFDLSLHMETSYSHIYRTYVDAPSSSNTIAAFKNELKCRTPFDKWSDFEMGMAEYAASLPSEEEFIECVRDFKQHMIEHLRKEDQQLDQLIQGGFYNDQLAKELDRSLEQFHGGFSPNVKTEFDRLTGKEYWNFNVITFNYTKSLEYLYITKFQRQRIIMKPPLHIHGDLYHDVVLGVDNIDQIKNTAYKLTKKGRRAFVKTIFNEQYDKNRVATARKMIANSSIICTYGFSLGESDQMWIDLLVEWLRKDPDHHLVVYKYDTTTYNQGIYDEVMDVEDAKKDELISRLGISDSNLGDQIHIPVGYDIFNFTFKKIEENPLPQHFNVFDTITDSSKSFSY